jgi:CRISPR-associated protein Cmr3
MTIEVTPLDTLFFRDGKPFSMGEDVWATGIFPSAPSVFYGMLRTAFASQNNINLSEIEDTTKTLKINSIILQKAQDYLFPYPADFITTKDDETKLLKPIKNNVISNLNDETEFILKAEINGKVKDYFGMAYINDIDFSDYQNFNENIDFQAVKNDEIYITEPKVGIARENTTNTTEESKIYRVGMIRPEKEVKFIINFEGLELEDKGFFKIGAENKIAHYKKINNLPEINYPEFIENKYLKIYLSTPAIFNNGHLPEFIEKGEFEGIKIKLLTYALGKPQYFGGFDMKKRKPKTMRKAVPAGSVYYLEVDNAKALADKIHGKSISEQLQNEGFGICFCGTFKI